MITINVDGIAAGQGVLRRNQYTGALYEASKGHKAWRDAVIVRAREAWAGADRWLCAVEVVAVFTFPRLKSHYSNDLIKATAPRYPRLRSTPDLDHLQRAVGDALVLAGCLRDDSQIAHWDAVKVYGEPPGATIAVRALEG
jgi:Holliday junction resolvase RusA-like endonuclease